MARLRPLGGEFERLVQVCGLEDPEAGEVFLRLQKGSVGEQRLILAIVDDGGRGRGGKASGEDPVTLGLESVVERVDGYRLVRSREADSLVDYGNQVLHRRSSPVLRGALGGQPVTRGTNTSAPICHRLPVLVHRRPDTPAATDPE